MFIKILFYVCLILACLGTFLPEAERPWLGRARLALVLIMISILAYWAKAFA